jgi:hypothetical protein
MSSSYKTKQATALVAEVSFIEQKFDWIFMGATAVNSIGTTTVEIERPDLGPDNPLKLMAEHNTLNLKRASANAKPLTQLPFLIEYVHFTVSSSTVIILYSINNQEFRYLRNIR